MSEPWFELPVVTAWQLDTEGGDTKVTASHIEKVRVKLRDVPSIINTPADVLNAMNQFDVYVAEKEQQAMEEAKAGR